MYFNRHTNCKLLFISVFLLCESSVQLMRIFIADKCICSVKCQKTMKNINQCFSKHKINNVKCTTCKFNKKEQIKV